MAGEAGGGSVCLKADHIAPVDAESSISFQLKSGGGGADGLGDAFNPNLNGPSVKCRSLSSALLCYDW